MNDRPQGEWCFPSKSNPSKHYTVRYHKYNGEWILSCNCPIWIYNRNNRHCWHTDEVENMGYPYRITLEEAEATK